MSEKIFPTAESNLTEKVPSLRDFTEISESHDESARTKNEKKRNTEMSPLNRKEVRRYRMEDLIIGK